MTSRRKRNKTAASRGLTPTELELAELLGEVLDELRWTRILAYSNQFLLSKHVDVSTEERDRILEAATRAVDQDQRLRAWHERLGQLKGEIGRIRPEINRARKDIQRGRAAPAPPGGAAGDEGKADGGGGQP